MAKKKTKKQVRQTKVLKTEVIGLLLLAVAILLGVSLYWDGSGNFTKLLGDGCRYLFGVAAYLVPVILIAYIIKVFAEPKEEADFWQLVPTLFLVIVASTFFYVYKEIDTIESGGLLGRAFGSLSVGAFGVVGTYVILGLIIAIYFVNLTKKSIIQFINNSIKKSYSETKGMAKNVATKLKETQITLPETNSPMPKNEKPTKEVVVSKKHEVVQKEDDTDEEIEASYNNEEIKIFGAEEDLKVESGKKEKEDNKAHNVEVDKEKDEEVELFNAESFEKAENEGDTFSSTKETISMPAPVKIPYTFPAMSLLSKNPSIGNTDSRKELVENAEKLEKTLDSFGVKAKVIQVNKGPTVTRYELQPSVGVKVSKIVNLADDIALNLAAVGVRIEAPIPGKAAIGIEIPNKVANSVYLREVLDTEEFKKAESKVSVGLGKDIAGKEIVIDLSKMPHLLIAGATGSGKSVCINSIITSILYKADPNEVKLLMIDPKVVELKMYNGIPHLLIPVVTEPKKAASALNWAVAEMLNRYQTFADNNVRDIKGYNKMLKENGADFVMPQVVIIIDELADLMMATPKEVEDAICRLAQMARAAGMNLIIATQRPSVDVITGVIKANIPSRIAFAVSSNVDSRTILDSAGAEKLLGKGDMLYHPVGESKPKRLQGAFVSDKEIENLVDFVKKDGVPVYKQEVIDQIINRNVSEDGLDDGEDDELIEQAIDLAIEKDKASISMFQRAFKIGYNRAARLMDQLEARGIVSAEEGTKPRRVLKDN